MTDNSVLVTLNGVHASGKSTIGSFLDNQGYRFLPETAQRLIDEGSYDPGKDSTSNFQESVFQYECQRDRSIIDQGNSAFIETWHIGNIAHAEIVAGQSLVQQQKEYLHLFKEKTDFEIKAIYLDISDDEILDRSNLYDVEDDEVLDFYNEIDNLIFQLYDQFDIDYFKIQNGDNSLGETEKSALAIAEEFIGSSDQSYNILSSNSNHDESKRSGD